MPLVVRYPGGEGKGRSERLVSLVDVMPSLLEMVGADAPPGHGLSWLGEQRHDYVVSEFTNPDYIKKLKGVISKDYK